MSNKTKDILDEILDIEESTAELVEKKPDFLVFYIVDDMGPIFSLRDALYQIELLRISETKAILRQKTIESADYPKRNGIYRMAIKSD